MGIRHYRLEFVHESGGEVAQIARAFAATLVGEQTAGVTESSPFVPPSFLEILPAVA